MKTASSLFLAASLVVSGGLTCAHANDPESLTEGITYTDGIFFPTHTISGMTYNPETKNYEAGPETPSSSLPDSGPLLSSYSNASDKRSYLGTLTAAEKASLVLGSSPEQAGSILGEISVPWSDWTVSVPDYQAKLAQARLDMEAMFRALPSDQVDDVINQMVPYTNRVYPGAPTYYGTYPWNTVQGINLSGLDLKDANFTGHNLSDVNLAGTNVTAAQLNQSGWANPYGGPKYYDRTVFTGLDLTGFDMQGRAFNYANFVGATLPSPASLMAASTLHGSNFSGQDLTGVTSFGNTSLEGVNFQNATGLTAQAIAKSYRIAGLNLRGTGITKDMLDAAIVAEGKSPSGMMDTAMVDFD